jgi:hypothetical protein
VDSFSAYGRGFQILNTDNYCLTGVWQTGWKIFFPS